MTRTGVAEATAALHRFGLARDRLRAALVRGLGLSITDLDALEHLELAGPLSQRELAERLVLTSGAVTQLVDRLESLSLVTRTRHPSDRRVTLVRLADAARLIPTPELDSYHAAVTAAAAALTVDSRRQLVNFLTAVADAATDTAISLRAGGKSSRSR